MKAPRRLLALEWSESEARLAVASLCGEEVVVEHAFCEPLESTPSGEPGHAKSGSDSGQPAPDATPEEIGKRIAAALSARGIRRVETVVAIGRASIELRQMTLPPAPDDELPEMVRFQALREFNALQEDWPLDYIPIDEDATEPRNVLAAAIAPELVEQIQGTCRAAGARLRRLILRPCAAASLFCRRQAEGLPKARLLVDLLADEADLTVMIDRKVIFLRTARLPGDPLTDPESTQAFLVEIRRTMAAVHNQLSGRRVESIALCGSGQRHAALCEQIGERLGIPTDLFDPFAGLKLEGELERRLPEHPARFAPLLGMLVDELQGSAHAVDFLHPRHKPVPPSPIKWYALAGLGAALVVGGMVLYGVWQYGRLSDEVARLDAEVKTWEGRAAQTAKLEKAAKEIQSWQAGDQVWLDQFRWLSERLPPAKDAMLTQFQASSSARGGEMKFDGLARSVESLKAVQDRLRDTNHRLVGKEAAESGANKDYSLRFSSSVYTVPAVPEPRKK